MPLQQKTTQKTRFWLKVYKMDLLKCKKNAKATPPIRKKSKFQIWETKSAVHFCALKVGAP